MSIRYAELPPHLQQNAVEVVAEALMIEPGFAYILPEESVRRRAMRVIIDSMCVFAMNKGKVLAALDGDAVLGAAMLVAPGNYPPTSSSDESENFLGFLTDHQLQQLHVFDQNAQRNFPNQPCWYLEALGVHPGSQGSGIGTGLMRYVIEITGNAPCYLETGSPKNVSFYERVGFAVMNSAAQLTPENGPTHWTMLRQP